MPIRPRPFKVCCMKCGYKKIVQFKSDALIGADLGRYPKFALNVEVKNFKPKT